MSNNIISNIKQQGLLPLYFHPDLTTSLETLQALYAAGIRIVEYTNRGVEAMRNFEALKKEASANMPEMMLALGTVMDAATARTAIGLGADFIISPGFVEEVGIVTRSVGVLWIPGCMTPTEIIHARSAGVSLVKLFPGNLLRAEYMRSIRELFPDMLFMPTGGVEATRESLTGWFDAGVCAVGMGSTLITKQALEKKEYRTITELAKKMIEAIQEIRNGA